ncbi:MAG TPA: hypothetical protein VEH62_06570 [Gemmatimonadales bacterium]|nr:hypothetical protein [Gemmatimonadales bacterium]
MRTLFARAAMLAGLAAAPAAGFAQGMSGMPHHELGVDLALVYQSPSGGTGVFRVMTPVDVRLGFVSSGNLSFEPRFVLTFASSSGTTVYNIGPDLNLLWKLGSGHGPHNLMGPYLTAGAGVNVISLGTGSTSGATFTVNAGLGTRVPWGAGAFRFEGFFAWTPKNTSLGTANTLSIGARGGISLWH